MRLRIGTTLALAIALRSASADAFCRSTTCSGQCERDLDECKVAGAPLFWRSQCVSFSLQRDGTEHLPFQEVAPNLQKTFYNWTGIECPGGGTASIAFSPTQDVVCHKAEYNAENYPNANILLFQDTRWQYKGGGENNIAKTTVSFDPDSGEIYDADIEMNFANNQFTLHDDEEVVYDLEAVITHEVGHFIGIDHSRLYEATMYYGYNEGDTYQRDLSEDDIEAICDIYPPDRAASCETSPKNGFGSLCAPEDAPLPFDPLASCSLAPASRAKTPTLLVALASAFILGRRSPSRARTKKKTT